MPNLYDYLSEQYRSAEAAGAFVGKGVVMLGGHSSAIEHPKSCNVDTLLNIKPEAKSTRALLYPARNRHGMVVLVTHEGAYTSGLFRINAGLESAGISDELGEEDFLTARGEEEMEPIVRCLTSYGFTPRIPRNRSCR